MNTFEDVYYLVRKIPRGKVTTYGVISQILRINPIVVGYALHGNKDPKNTPCHRVVKKDGKIALGYAFGGKKWQIKKLKEEGISFVDKDTVDLKKHLSNLS